MTNTFLGLVPSLLIKIQTKNGCIHVLGPFCLFKMKIKKFMNSDEITTSI